MIMHHSRKIAYDTARDHIATIAKKLANNELGTTEQEKRANIFDYFIKSADIIKGYLDRFVTVDEDMMKLKNIIRLISDSPEPVLITGPTGTGKELLARALSRTERGTGKLLPFIAENCAGFPESLAESIFFGHKKGSFTGAIDNHVGLLEEAKSGVVFLDEVGDMPITLQAKFLRAIQEHEIRRVGEVTTREIDCRFIAATKYNLEERVAQGLFRDDLYGRLMTFPLMITGLKERPHDIKPILQSMLPVPEDVDKLPPFSDKALTYIHRYNVRALESLLAQWRRTASYLI